MYQSEFGRRLREQSSSASALWLSAQHDEFDHRAPTHRNGSRASSSATSLADLYAMQDEDRARPAARDLDRSSARPVSDRSPSRASTSRPQTPNDQERRSRKGSMQGDRYIPNRDGSDIQAAFQLMSNEPSTPNRHKRKISAADMDAQKEEANETFTSLLSSELFGADSSAFVAAINARSGTGAMSSTQNGLHQHPHQQNSVASASRPTTPTKRNIFHYGSKSPSSSISRSRSITNLTTTPPSGSAGSSAKRSESVSPSRRRGSNASLFGGASPSSASRKADLLDSPQHDLYNVSPVSLESQRVLQSPRKAYRALSKVPYKVLDAPDLADDFYLNLVDWSSKNVLGVGLSHCVYLWSAQTSDVKKLCEVDRECDRITSVNWSGRGDHLAVGLSSGAVQIWDAESLQLLRTFSGHTGRVGSLAWNEHVLSTGSRDRSILHRDVRVRDQSIRELKSHVQEICGLKWNTTSNQLASGGNDNKLLVWDGMNTVPLYKFGQHRAAVKAIAWSPHQNGLLASGGGTADMHIRFFNTITGSLLSEVDTGSQVCNLAWSRINNEIISTHGFSGGKISNQVQVWRYPDMSQVATLMGHTMRVLYLAMSPDGESVVSGAGDETLRFWDLNTPGKGILSTSSSTSAMAAKVKGVYSTGSLNPFVKLR